MSAATPVIVADSTPTKEAVPTTTKGVFANSKKQFNEAKEACETCVEQVKKTASEKVIRPAVETKDATIKYAYDQKAAVQQKINENTAGVQEKVQIVRSQVCEKCAALQLKAQNALTQVNAKTAGVQEKVQGVRAQVCEKCAALQLKAQSIRTQVTDKSAEIKAKAQSVRTQVSEKSVVAQEKALASVERFKGEPSEAGTVEKSVVAVASFVAKVTFRVTHIGLDALGMTEYTQKRVHTAHESLDTFVKGHPSIENFGNALVTYWPIKIGHRILSQVSANAVA